MTGYPRVVVSLVREWLGDKSGARRASRCRVTFEKETRRKPLAGRDAYGGSNVLWYCSGIRNGLRCTPECRL